MFENYCFYYKNFDLVLVDMKIVVEVLLCFLVLGIVDVMVMWVEVCSVIVNGGKMMVGGIFIIVGEVIVEKCEEVLFKYGYFVYEFVKVKVVIFLLEVVVEVNIFLSGLGFESGGLAVVYVIYNGFIVFEGEIYYLIYGEKVVFGMFV